MNSFPSWRKALAPSSSHIFCRGPRKRYCWPLSRWGLCRPVPSDDPAVSLLGSRAPFLSILE